MRLRFCSSAERVKLNAELFFFPLLSLAGYIRSLTWKLMDIRQTLYFCGVVFLSTLQFVPTKYTNFHECQTIQSSTSCLHTSSKHAAVKSVYKVQWKATCQSKWKTRSREKKVNEGKEEKDCRKENVISSHKSHMTRVLRKEWEFLRDAIIMMSHTTAANKSAERKKNKARNFDGTRAFRMSKARRGH